MKNNKNSNLFRGIQTKVVFPLFIIFSFMSTAAVAEVNVANFLELSSPMQIAKVEKTYDKAIGEKVNWRFFSSGAEMAKAMVAGEIDIAYYQGMAPFVNAINANAPIKIIGIAVAYDAADDCVVRNALEINRTNIKELEGKTVALPTKSNAEFGFRMTMRYLGVDTSKMKIIHQEVADAVHSLLETEVDLACVWGQNSISKMKRVGKSLLTTDEKKAAGMSSFLIISVTEKFAKEKPEAVRQFLRVTAGANAAFATDKSKINVIAKDAGLTLEKATAQLSTFSFPTVDEQLNSYFSNDGIATKLVPFMGEMFATDEFPRKADYSRFIDTSFLKEMRSN